MNVELTSEGELKSVSKSSIEFCRDVSASSERDV